MVMKETKLIEFEKALSAVLKNVPVVGSERLKLDSAVGRVLMEDIKADRPIPPFNRSAMDGYAVRFSDFKKEQTLFTVVGTLEAGREWKGKIKKGETLKIMTGAPVPLGADMVIKVENSRIVNGALGLSGVGSKKRLNTGAPVPLGADMVIKVGNSRVVGDMVELTEIKPAKWLNVHRQGSDTKKGKTVLRKGKLLHPADIPTASSVGAAKVKVSKRLRVFVITTGSEVVSVDKKPKSYEIRDSNLAFLHAMFQSMPSISASYAGPLKDDPALFKKRLVKAISKSDLVIVTGGVSMGDSDYTYRVLEEIKVKKIFHKCAIRPGKPLWFGLQGRCAVFGLPGNPVSVMATFHEFVLPALKKMSNALDVMPKSLRLPLISPLSKKHGLREFRPALLTNDGIASVGGYKGSGDFINASLGNGFVVLPEDKKDFPVGESVEFHPWTF